MAKKQLKDYRFVPGSIPADASLYPNSVSLIGANKNYIIEEIIGYLTFAAGTPASAPTAYPNAISLLTNNKNFIVEEISAWISRQVTNGRSVTPTTATYTPATGQMVLDIGTHTVAIGDAIKIATNGLTFTCALDSNATLHSYPRSTGEDPYYNKYMIVTAVAGTTITVNVGISSNTSAHTFVSAVDNAVTIGFKDYYYDSTVQSKCKRDVGYLVDAFIADVTGGGNAETIRIGRTYWRNGVAQLISPAEEGAVYTFAKTLVNTYVLPRVAWPTWQSPVVAAQVTSGSSSEAAAITRFNTLIDIVRNVIPGGLATLPALSYNYNSAFVGYTYDSAKCRRDSEYIIDSYIYDMAYGGNSSTWYVSSRYWIQGIAQVDGSRAPEIAAHTFARNLINNYVLAKVLHPSYQTAVAQTVLSVTPSAGATTKITTLSNILLGVIQNGLSSLPRNDPPASISGNLMPNAIELLQANKRYIAAEAAAYIAYNTANNISPFIYFTYDSSKCERDVSYIIEGYITDLRHGGNRQTVHNASKYWENGVAAVDGSRQPEISAHTFIRDLIDNYILTNVAYVSKQTKYAQTINNSIIAETFAQTRIRELSNTVLEVIQYGLDYLPATVSNRGYIKVPGFYKLKDFLLVTNTDKNEILYNFADPDSAAEVTYSEFNDSDFAKFVQTTDKITTLTFDVDTTGMMVTDNIQIFVEGKEQIVHMNSSASDAMERVKVGIPQAMLDADFEYGLQPTKWQTISLMRSYPSIYEVPGTDVQVSNVVTDASTGTAGIGASLMTVTTIGPHGFSIGSPFTIKALANTVTGFSRAEGSFLVSSVPSTTSFTYYAKSKVGTTNGQILATGYTQLRVGAFYTGSSVGSPTITVSSNGSSGSFTTNLLTASGSDFIGFTGTIPPIGAPISGTGITTGTQITAVSGPGGTAATTTLTANADIGVSEITVNSVTGLQAGLVLDRGDGRSIRVTNVLGSVVSLSGPLTSKIIGTNASYNGLTGATSGSGVNAVFTVSRAGSTYSAVATTPGESYSVNDTITILGTGLEGAAPANNATLTVTAASDKNTVASFNQGTIFGGSGYTQTTNVGTRGGSGTGLTVNLTVDGNGSVTAVAVNQAGKNYAIGETISIKQGRVLSLNLANSGSGFTTGTKTTTTTGLGLGLTVDVVASNIGGVSFVTQSAQGTGYTSGIFNTTNGSGSGLTVNIQASPIGGASTITIQSPGSGYSDGNFDTSSIIGTGEGLNINVTTTAGSITDVSIASGGTGYAVNNTATVLGGNNDAVIRVTAVTNGQVTGISIETPGINYQVGDLVTIAGGNNNATFTVDTITNGQITSISVNNPGAGYEPDDSITISGGTSGFATVSVLYPEASVQIASVNAGGFIQSVSAAGTPITAPSKNFISAVTISEVTTANINTGTTISYSAIATLQIDFATDHGFIPGDSITVEITSNGTNHQLAAGPYYVEQVPIPTRLRYTARTAGSIDTLTPLAGFVYARPDSYYVHRPFDGGVQLGTGGPQHGAAAVRQSKKYIRYQSGKGVMYNTGALFAPSYDIRSMTANGTTPGSLITITTDDTDHGCQVGAGVTIFGADTTGYNGQFTVVDVVDERIFKVQATKTLGATTALLSSECKMSVRSWHGATVRAGAFDDQNGMFWQYDGRKLSVVKRSSTFQVAGVIAVNADSNAVTGTSTRFTQQLAAGDRIVVRGMSHTVTRVISDTSITIAPDYRGVANVDNVKIVKTIDEIIPQEYWNIDPCNGSGPSGYNIDITKMQMIGLQYTWYGAGFIDFMLRGADGNYVYAHRIRNSNVNTEAFMRTGNLPVRYEVINEGAKGVLSGNMTNSQTTIPLKDTYWFPDNGTVLIDSEMISYTGRTATELTGCTRAAQITQFVAGSQRNFTGGSAATHTASSGVILISNTVTPIISHWGSAFLTDGRFDEDRGYIFNYTATNISVSTTKQTAFLIRLAPSVSNAIIGDLGERELLNKAQLLLQSVAITSDTGTGGIVVEGVLNPQNYPSSPSDITWSGLSNSAAGGQPSFAQIAPGGAVVWPGQGSFTTSTATTANAAFSGTITAEPVYSSGGNLSSTGTNSIYNNRDRIYVLESNYQVYVTNGIAVGDGISGTGIPVNNTIRSFDTSTTTLGASVYRGIRLTNNTTSTVSGASTVTIKRTYRTSSTSTIHFTQATWESSGAKAGTEVTDAIFPANTFVSSASLQTFFGSTYYKVSFTQTSNSTTIVPGTTIVTFRFGVPVYAQPGETVFSFIASPGGTSELQLDKLKELTNTTLGGRGTFPNGPDVLALNVYKASGEAVNCNILLRWGEAQA